MNLGELFIKLGVIGDTKKLDKAIKQMEEADKKTKRLTQYKKDLASATTKEEKAQVKKNFADKVRLENLKKTKNALVEQNAQWLGLAKGIGAFIAAATIAYKVVDRLVNSFAQSNQQLITFQRTSGISFKSLNKYASANAAVNFNSTIEGTAQSMQRVAQNLWDIRMGRGDISPYQELAFVGGKAFNPMGMSVEQVIESVREAIKGVDDLQATNIITRMGFAPDDLLMLRMSREEFEKINDMFLSPQQREAMNKYALELKKTKLEFDKLGQIITLDLAKPFIQLAKILQRLSKLLYIGIVRPIQVAFKFISDLIKTLTSGINYLITSFVKAHQELKPIFDILKMLAELIVLPLEDLFVYLSGGDSLVGRGLDAIEGIFQNLDAKFKESGIKKFFKCIEDGIKNLATLSLPNWLIGLFTGNWVPVAAELIKMLSPSVSMVAPPIDTNYVSYAGNNNWNTNNNFSITTNQPMEIVADNLINKFMPTQVQYGIRAV